MLITYQARPPVDLPAKQAEHTARGGAGLCERNPAYATRNFMAR